MRQVFAQCRAIAAVDAPVLLRGESGTGKELVARAIHAESTRCDAPFIAINCAGIPPGLLETELFGHASGAFTGAASARAGLFAAAAGGTLLLDEVGEMPLEMQAKLLRVLDGGQLRRVGETHERDIDVRIISATHRDLAAEITAGRFRVDLYYRLETFTLGIPPLRERPEDIRLLTRHFIRQFATRLGRPVTGMTTAALSRLLVYPFPGNVRELSNVIEQAVALCRRARIDIDDLPERLRDPEPGDSTATMPPHSALHDPDDLPTLEELDHRYIHYVLARHNGNKQRTAATLGIGRRTLYRYLARKPVDD